MNKKAERLVLDPQKFDNDIWDVVGDVLKIISAAGYICSIKTEENLVIIDFQDEDPNIGGAMLAWLSIDEYESITWDNEKEENLD